MYQDRTLEPRLRSVDAQPKTWGLFSHADNSWSHLTFPTKAAAKEAAPMLARAGLG